MKASFALVLFAILALAGCAADTGHHGDYRISTRSSDARVEIANVKTRVQKYGLVITGQVHIAPNINTTPVPLTVDIAVTGTDGKGAGKFTCAYYPIPKPNKKKPQTAHFTVVMSNVAPPGSSVDVSLTPPAVPDQPVIVKPF